MLRLSDAHRFRKTVAGACMVAAPLLLLIAMVLHPERDGDAAAQLAIARGELDAWYASHLIALASVALVVPAVLGLMHMLREREVAWGHAGGALALLGAMALVAVLTIDGLVTWQMAAAGDAPELAALLDRLTETAGVAIPTFALSLAFPVGLVLLAAGLYRARAVQSWTAACVAVGALALAVAFPAEIGWLTIVGSAFLVVGLGSIGRMVMSEPDEAWEHTPEYDDFRPLLGTR